MRSRLNVFSLLFVLLFCSCSKTDSNLPSNNEFVKLYFPPIGDTSWSGMSESELNWQKDSLSALRNFLSDKNTKAFLVLKDGKIALEWYFDNFGKDSNWYWASAGKTLTAMLVGIAYEDSLLNLQDKTSDYLGTGWTSLTLEQEDRIRIRHQLTMTTGLDDNVTDKDCTSDTCLRYKADAGIRWAYHNAPYTLLDKVVENASGMSYNNFFRQKIRDRIGMNGGWIKVDQNNVFFSTARSMARYGLLLLNKGRWDQTAILRDSSYHLSMITGSQPMNPSYGYLTWLNGKDAYMLPSSQIVFPGMLIPNAPADCYAALGKNDQKLYVVPSKGLVVVRMGDAAYDSRLAVTVFDNEIWGRLKGIIGY
jgi:CubicO group peptidase (beta-lactamase class C family)